MPELAPVMGMTRSSATGLTSLGAQENQYWLPIAIPPPERGGETRQDPLTLAGYLARWKTHVTFAPVAVTFSSFISWFDRATDCLTS